MKYKKLLQLKNLLLSRAQSRKTIKYPEIYNFFDDTEKHTMWRTFESACNLIAESKDAIYGVLMSNKDGIPAEGFYDIFENKRRIEYKRIASNKHYADLSMEDKKEIAAFERDIVYAHASAYIEQNKLMGIYNDPDLPSLVVDALSVFGVACIGGTKTPAEVYISKVREYINTEEIESIKIGTGYLSVPNNGYLYYVYDLTKTDISNEEINEFILLVDSFEE